MSIRILLILRIRNTAGTSVGKRIAMSDTARPRKARVAASLGRTGTGTWISVGISLLSVSLCC